jgi:hypothetical protein
MDPDDVGGTTMEDRREAVTCELNPTGELEHPARANSVIPIAQAPTVTRLQRRISPPEPQSSPRGKDRVKRLRPWRRRSFSWRLVARTTNLALRHVRHLRRADDPAIPPRIAS